MVVCYNLYTVYSKAEIRCDQYSLHRVCVMVQNSARYILQGIIAAFD